MYHSVLVDAEKPRRVLGGGEALVVPLIASPGPVEIVADSYDIVLLMGYGEKLYPILSNSRKVLDKTNQLILVLDRTRLYDSTHGKGAWRLVRRTADIAREHGITITVYYKPAELGYWFGYDIVRRAASLGAGKLYFSLTDVAAADLNTVLEAISTLEGILDASLGVAAVSDPVLAAAAGMAPVRYPEHTLAYRVSGPVAPTLRALLSGKLVGDDVEAVRSRFLRIYSGVWPRGDPERILLYGSDEYVAAVSAARVAARRRPVPDLLVYHGSAIAFNVPGPRRRG